MAEKKKVKVDPPYEEKETEKMKLPLKLIAAIVCFGIALLTLYMAFAAPQEGTAMLSVRNIIRGLSGDIPFLLSIIFVWIGVLCIGSSKGRKVNTFHVIVYLILFLSIFAAVHVFSAETVTLAMNVRSYPQFIAVSYQKGIGGGLLGSLIAYPLYEYIGEFGGCIVCVLLVLLCLVATGRASRIYDWGKAQSDKNRQHREERNARIAHENKHVFDDFDEEPERRRANRAPARREPRAADRPHERRETPQQGAQRRQSRKIAHTVSQPDRDVMHIPDRNSPENEQKKAASTDFYDEEPESAPSRRRKRVPQQNIEIPKTMSELKGTADGRGRSRFSDPNSTRRPAKGRNAASEPQSTASSVSSEAMSVVAEQTARGRKDAKTLPDEPLILEEENEEMMDGATPEEVDDIFTVDEDDAEPEQPERTVPVSRPAPAVLPHAEDSRLSAGISRETAKLKREKTFIETNDPEYNYPPIDLLEHGDRDDQLRKHEETDQMKAEILMNTLQSFGIHTQLSGIAHGPAVTRFELQPDAGIKVSRIASLSDDIAMALAAESVRIEAPIPGKAAVGVEIPNDKIETVRLRDVLESSEALHNTSKIAVGLGKDNSGRYVVADIAKMPHVLIAGQTGSGKSVCINSIITSILYRSTPEDVRLILIDPKVVELQVYNDIPHLIAPVVTDPKKASSALQWAVSEMLERYKKFSKKGVRNIKGYNAALSGEEKKMPQIVIVIDELADLMMAAPGEVEDSICRIAQLARAAGMHLVIATQRPSVNIVTGIIKANIPTRIAFAVASQTDSRVMIDHGGAEKLLGNGDMLFVPNGGKTLRVQGTWVSDDEVEAVVSYIKERCDPNYDEDVQEKIENSVKSDAEIEDANNELDDRLAEAVEIVVELGQASVSMLQRKMRVGYARAGRLIDEMQKRGIVSEADGAKPRTVLMTREQFRQTFGENI